MMTINNQPSHGLRRYANNVCYGTGLDLCTSTNPYVGESCGYGTLAMKKNAKCPKCRCQIIEGQPEWYNLKSVSGGRSTIMNFSGYYACGIGSNDDDCNPAVNH